MTLTLCDDEDDENILCTLNCDQLRRKVNAFLATGQMTQTAFLKELKVNSNSFRRFMSYKGARFLAAGKGQFKGNENGTYSKAYFFFERNRIALNEEKTKKRLANERDHPEGFPTNNLSTFHRIYSPFM